MPVTNPATGLDIGTVPRYGAAETRLTIEAAEAAWPAWRSVKPKNRRFWMRKWYDLIMENQEDLAILRVPGIYTHGALAIPNDHELVEETGVKRDVNRSVIDSDKLVAQLKDPRSKRALLCPILLKLALNRTRNRAIHPQGE